MMNVAYFIDQAEASTQQEFNNDWSDVIIYRDDDSTNLITEDLKHLTLNWKDEKYLNYSIGL
jgi:hypothetical protein